MSSIRFECHLVPNGDNPILAHMNMEEGHYPRLKMQPFDAFVVTVEQTQEQQHLGGGRITGARYKATIYLNGKVVASS